MILSVGRRFFIHLNHPIVLKNYLQCRRMSNKLELKSIPESYVQSRVREITNVISAQTVNLSRNIARITPDAESSARAAQSAQEKLLKIWSITKVTFFVTCEHATVLAKSPEMSNALEHTMSAIKTYFVLLRRIGEEIVVIFRKISQSARHQH
ncbi:hypothetical protein DMENIID0001_042480 [Sergentomyia squamirostris]